MDEIPAAPRSCNLCQHGRTPGWTRL